MSNKQNTMYIGPCMVVRLSHTIFLNPKEKWDSKNSFHGNICIYNYLTSNPAAFKLKLSIILFHECVQFSLNTHNSAYITLHLLDPGINCIYIIPTISYRCCHMLKYWIERVAFSLICYSQLLLNLFYLSSMTYSAMCVTTGHTVGRHTDQS